MNAVTATMPLPLMAEVSSISKRKGRLVAHAKDPIFSGLSIDELRSNKPEVRHIIDRLDALVSARKDKPAA